MRRLVILVVILAVISQLTTAQQRTTPVTYVPVNDTLYFLGDETNTFDLKTETGGWDHLTIISDKRINDLLDIQREESIRKGGIDGFRVQIYQGRSLEEAEKIKARFLLQYPDFAADRVYIRFPSPDFRVRVGDFRTRSEAIHMKYKIARNFPNPYIVDDVINFPELD